MMITNVMITNVIFINFINVKDKKFKMRCFILHISRLIRVLPSRPRFTLISVFYPLVRPSVRSSAFYTFIRICVLPLPVFSIEAYKTVKLMQQIAANINSLTTLNEKTEYDVSREVLMFLKTSINLSAKSLRSNYVYLS